MDTKDGLTDEELAELNRLAIRPESGEFVELTAECVTCGVSHTEVIPESMIARGGEWWPKFDAKLGIHRVTQGCRIFIKVQGLQN